MPSDFEKELSQIAYSYIQEKHPDIFNYIIAFELTEYDEKESKGVGYFALNINKKYYYAPVFFINGEMKDLILLYHKDTDQFMPLTEKQISQLESEKVIEMGQGIKNPPHINKSPFDFREIMNPTYATKYASKREGLNFDEAAPFWAKQIKEKTENKFIDFLKQSSNFTKVSFLNHLKESKPLMFACASNYDVNEVIEACAPHKVEKQSSVPDFEHISFDSYDAKAHEKMSLVNDGYCIRDNRDFHKKAYEIKYTEICESPKTDGIYKVPSCGEVKEVLVASKPFAIAEDYNIPGDIAVCMDTKSWNSYDGEGLIAQHQLYEKFDGVEPYELLVKAPIKAIKKMSIGKEYMIYDSSKRGKSGCFSEPFTVEKKMKGKDKMLTFCVTPKYSYSKSGEVCICIGDKIKKISKLNNKDMYAPSHLVVVELGDQDLMITGSGEIDESINRRLDRYKVAPEGIFRNNRYNCCIRDEKCSALHLAKTAGIHFDKAVEFVRHGRRKPIEFWVEKSAIVRNPHSLGSGPSVRTNAFGGPYGAIPEHPTERPTLNISRAEENNQAMEGPYLYPKEDIESLIGLSKLDDIKLLDEGMIGTLAKMQDPSVIIKKFLPDLNRAVDKLGKMIMIMWYHAYKVKQDFGINEYQDFEEMLKDTFLHLGEIILTVFEKDLSKRIT